MIFEKYVRYCMKLESVCNSVYLIGQSPLVNINYRRERTLMLFDSVLVLLSDIILPSCYCNQQEIVVLSSEQIHIPKRPLTEA